MMRYTLQQIKDGTGFRSGTQFEEVTDYNGWPNRETWAVALHINNDQGWQEIVHDALRSECTSRTSFQDRPSAEQNRLAGDIIRENVESYLDALLDTDVLEYRNVRDDLGSLWRVDWTDLGWHFLSDVEELDA